MAAYTGDELTYALMFSKDMCAQDWPPSKSKEKYGSQFVVWE